MRLHVTSPRVESAIASGGAHVNAQATRVDGFKVASSGGVLRLEGRASR